MKLGALGTHEAGGGSLPKRRGNQPWLPWWCSGKNPPANAGDAGDAGSILGSGESPEEEMATLSSMLAWRIPWTEEAGGLQSRGSQRGGCGCDCMQMHKHVKHESALREDSVNSDTQTAFSAGFSHFSTPAT